MVYAFPALVALVLKLGIFHFYRAKLLSGSPEIRVLVLFLGFLAALNVFEIGVFLLGDSGGPASIRVALMDGWYTFSVFSLASCAAFSIYVADLKFKRAALFFLLGCAAVLSLFIVFTDFVIKTYIENSAAMTKIAGPYYFAYQMFAIASSLTMIGLLALGLFGSSRLDKARAATMLFGLLPCMLVVIAVVISQQFGGSLSAGVLVPAAITFYLWVLIYSSTSESLINPIDLLPFSDARRKRRFAVELFKEKERQPSLKSQLQELEDILILQAVKDAGGVQKDAAEILGISPAKISARLKALRVSYQQQATSG